MLPILFTKLHAVSGADIGYHNPDDPVQGVVQAPGFVCMRTGRPLYNGIVVQNGDSLDLWAPLGREGEGLPDNTTWEDEIDRNLGLFSLADKTTFQALPKNQRAYFRSLNFYRLMLPEDQMVAELWAIYHDDGALTITQRNMVDRLLFAGSDYHELSYAYLTYATLDVLASLGEQPGLDQRTVQKFQAALRASGHHVPAEEFALEKIEQFSALIRPLSERLVQQWPPREHVLSLW
jgi:hypothetical protein